AYRLVGGASVLRISRVVGGVEKVLVQTPVPNPTQNVPFRLRASIAGTTLTLQLIDGATTSISDPTFTGGGVGVMFSWPANGTPSYAVDDFKACGGAPLVDCSGIQ